MPEMFVKVVTGPDVAAGLVPAGYSPLWRVPDQDAWYCVPTRAAETIRLNEQYAEEHGNWAAALRKMEP